jgi:hypothetical protein
VLRQEAGNAEIDTPPVVPLQEAMALVREGQVIDRHVPAPQRRHDLLALMRRHAGVSQALRHQHRAADLLDLVERRQALQQPGVLHRIAVFGGTVADAPGARALKEGLPTGDAVVVDARSPEFRVFGNGGQHHPPTVALAHDADARGIEPVLGGEPGMGAG